LANTVRQMPACSRITAHNPNHKNNVLVTIMRAAASLWMSAMSPLR